MVVAASDLPSALRIFGESTRLRLLALLDREELSVRELCACVGMAQSRVSNHLRVLREAGLLIERHAGRSTFLRLANPDTGTMAERLWEALRAELVALPEHDADLERLERVLAEREGGSDFFDRVAGQWDTISGEFATGQARPRAVSHLVPAEFVVADLGCGTGYLTERMARHVGRVIGVDNTQAMLDAAAQRTQGFANVELREGDLQAAPIEDGACDAAMLSLVLTYVSEPIAVLREAGRVLKFGGKVVIVDLLEHDRDEFRRELEQRWLGFDSAQLTDMLTMVGFDHICVRALPPEPHVKGPALLLATGTKSPDLYQEALKRISGDEQ